MAVSCEPGFVQGKLIAQKYRIDNVLGKGGIGVVVSATYVHLEHKVAIKFLRSDQELDPIANKRFLREARAAARIRSEHVARVYDYGTGEDGVPYIVMERLEGTDLSALLSAGPLPVETAVDYVLQVCVALAEAHREGVVHRDLKPANLFLTRRSDGADIIKVLDFGVSKILNERGRHRRDFTTTDGVMGSPEYMSPEQMKNAKDIDARADIWAVGVVLYELLTARPAFTAATIAELFYKVTRDEPDAVDLHREGVPEALRETILRCLRKRKQDRFADVQELAESLGSVAAPKSEPYLKVLSNLPTPAAPRREVRPSQHDTVKNPDWSSRPTRKGRPFSTVRLPLSRWGVRSLAAGLAVLGAIAVGATMIRASFSHPTVANTVAAAERPQAAPDRAGPLPPSIPVPPPVPATASAPPSTADSAAASSVPVDKLPRALPRTLPRRAAVTPRPDPPAAVTRTMPDYGDRK